jgi:tyrosinase
MSDISRRSFISTATIATLGGAGLTRAVQAQAPAPVPQAGSATQPYIRYNVASPQGQANLAKYRQAVQTMMGMPSSSPLSWVFQWYTHWVRADSTKAAQINSIFGPNPSPARTLAMEMWDTCQAHANTGGPDEWYFMPWHRMYVYYFEHICRKVLNDNTFALPYWNYSSANTRAIPAAFRVAGSPLYRVNRNPGINAGNPIDQGQPAGSLSPNPSLSRGTFAGATGFNQTLDLGLHGNVHVDVGNNQGMGSIPWSANDPIFWMHHCNIDRLWASWNRAGRPNPASTAWLDKTFTFANENGMAVLPKVRDVVTTAALGYTYDHFEPVPPAAAAPAAVTATLTEPATTTLATSLPAGAALTAASGIALEPTGTRITLAPAASPTLAPAPALTGRVESLPPEKQLFLMIKNYHADLQPGVIYLVYLDLPPANAPAGGEGHYVGAMQFFGVVPHDGHESHGASAAILSFDITDLAKRLQAEGALTNSPAVTIVPSGEPAENAKPIIGEISIVEQ